MIREVTMFETDDGEQFNYKPDAVRHERKVYSYSKCLAILGDVRPDYDGKTYVQHEPETVLAFSHQVCLWLREHMSRDLAARWAVNPRGFVGRLLDDTSSLGHKLYSRMVRIDSDNREWGQLYFAENPNSRADAVPK